MLDWAETYGDPFFLNALNGPVVLTGRPELIRQIFSHDPMEYDAFAADALRPILGSGSLLLLSGEKHRRERKLVMPMFHGERMRAYGDIMQRAVIDAMQPAGSGAPFMMLDVTTQISLTVIVEAIFGGEDTESIRDLLAKSREAVRRSSPLLFFSPKLHFRFLGLSPGDRFRRAKAELRGAFAKELARRRAEPADREDILTMLINARYEDGTLIDVDHAQDELGTFLFAGHETSAIAMAWACYHLHRNPDSLQKLRDELASLDSPTPEALAKLPYLKAVVQETLRLHPIVTEVLRVLKSPMQLDRYEIPAGIAVAAATVLAHYRPETFPEPHAFRPERFLEKSYSSSEYFPFGGGHRRCAGAAFASYEMMIVLGTLLSSFHFRLLEPRALHSTRRNVTMGPSTGVLMQVVGREE